MNHEEAWARLPDLLDDRDDAPLLAHLRECADCQRQLFLLGRVDRLLRDRAGSRRPRRRLARLGLLAATAAVAVTALLLALFLPGQSSAHGFTLRTAAGRAVGLAKTHRSDGHNLSLDFTAHGLPVSHTHMLVLWARAGGSSMAVGEFMVNASGGCRVHFNLPATHNWEHFWVADPGNAAAVVASTD
jgi:hypothetical protein